MEANQKWMTEEILDIMEERRLVKDDKAKYKSLSKIINKKCRKAKEQFYEEKYRENQLFDKAHNPTMYKKIKELNQKPKTTTTSIKDKNGKLLTENYKIAERWAENVEELYNDKRPTYIAKNNNYQKVKIEKEEIIDIIKQLQKSKATGVDKFPEELLQHMGEEGLNSITNITIDCYDTGILPEDFLQSTFVTIPKAPNTTLCNEHRTISLISHASKILLQIMKRRITP